MDLYFPLSVSGCRTEKKHYTVIQYVTEVLLVFCYERFYSSMVFPDAYLYAELAPCPLFPNNIGKELSANRQMTRCDESPGLLHALPKPQGSDQLKGCCPIGYLKYFSFLYAHQFYIQDTL